MSKVLKDYLAGGNVHAFEVGKQLADADPELAAKAARKLLETSPTVLPFVIDAKSLRPAFIHALLAPVEIATTSLALAFLRLAVPLDEPQLADRWQRAIAALTKLEATDGWDSPALKSKLRELADDPPILEAIQGTIANARGEVTGIAKLMLAVLVTDGSPASNDALVPCFGAMADFTRLGHLRELVVHAAPSLEPLFAVLKRDFAAEESRSPALEFARAIGLADYSSFWFRFHLVSQPQARAEIVVDSRIPKWFDVSIFGEQRTTWFGGREFLDELAIGRCEPADLPAWLRAAAATLYLTPWVVREIESSLDVNDQFRVERWLLGHRDKAR